MSVRTQIKTAAIVLESAVAALCRPFSNERGMLLSFMFHGLFLNADELDTETVDPQQGITVAMFRNLLLHFKRESYRFVSPQEILKDLSPDGKYVLITFDDGYYNNVRALPVLEEFEAPAVFFVSTGHVRQGKAYWWDVVHREFKKRRRSGAEVRQAVAGYKRLRTSEIERSLETEVGENAFKPVGDLDRPFTPSELSRFADHPLVFLGNHTRDHAILTNYDACGMKEQIQGAQDDIVALTGRAPQIIAYPNGNYCPDAIEISRKAGLLLGMTAEPGKNALPMRSTQETMTMKRFMLWGDRGVDQQCQVFRSSLALSHVITRSRMRRNLSQGPA